MPNAIESLLADHKMITKLLDGFAPENPRYETVFNTMIRVVKMHAWLEDTVLLPAFTKEKRLQKRFLDQISGEHKDIEYFLDQLKTTPRTEKKELEDLSLQYKAILKNHLQKEEDALFPLAERILDSEGLLKMSADMKKKQSAVHEELGI